MTDSADQARQAELEDSRRYLETSGREGSALAWAGEDLRDLQLAGATLHDGLLIEAKLDRANLECANLSHAQAGGASFASANLTAANLAKTSLTGASFRSANARGARFRKANLTDADLTNANLNGAQLDGASCPGASFVNAQLAGATFWTAHLGRADLSGADLTNARFDRTTVDYTTRFDGCTGIDRAQITSVILGELTLAGDNARGWMALRARFRPWPVADFEPLFPDVTHEERDRPGYHRQHAKTRSHRTSADHRRRCRCLRRDHSRRGRLPADLGTTWKDVSARGDRGTFAGSTRSEYVLPTWPS